MKSVPSCGLHPYPASGDHTESPMRKIFSFIMATVDGYYEGPNQEFDSWTIDHEFEEFSLEQLDEVDTLVFGRATYEGMAAYWPTRAAQIPHTRRTRATQAAARQGHRDSRRLRTDGEPPADGAGRRTAGHEEPRRSRRRQIGVQDGHRANQPEATEEQVLRVWERAPLLPARCPRDRSPRILVKCGLRRRETTGSDRFRAPHRRPG